MFLKEGIFKPQFLCNDEVPYFGNTSDSEPDSFLPSTQTNNHSSNYRMAPYLSEHLVEIDFESLFLSEENFANLGNNF